MEWLPAIFTAVGTVSEMAGNAQQAGASRRAFKEEANVIATQTRLNREAAAKQNRFIIAKNQARTAAAGVESGSGSPLAFDLEQAFNAGMQEQTIQWEGDVRRRAALMGSYNVSQELPGKQFGALLQGGSKLY